MQNIGKEATYANPYGRRAFDRFLEKIGLVNDLIKTEKQQTSPTQRVITNANELVNILEEMKPLVTSLKELTEGSLSSMQQTKDGFEVVVKTDNETKKINISLDQLKILSYYDYEKLQKNCLDLKNRDILDENQYHEAEELFGILGTISKNLEPYRGIYFGFVVEAVHANAKANKDQLQSLKKIINAENLTPAEINQNIENAVKKTDRVIIDIDKTLERLQKFKDDLVNEAADDEAIAGISDVISQINDFKTDLLKDRNLALTMIGMVAPPARI